MSRTSGKPTNDHGGTPTPGPDGPPGPDPRDGSDGPPGSATHELMQLVYDELRAVAAEYLRHERPGHTLQPTALVHEAYLRLAKLDRIEWRDKTHFHVAASGAIRRVLVDHARGKHAAKRGGGGRRLTLTDADLPLTGAAVDVLVLDEALDRLNQIDERKRRVVELRFFGGLTIDETAKALGVGATTVEDDWVFARAWLRRELGEGQS